MIHFVESPGRPVLDELATVRKDIDLFAGWLTALPNPDKILREQPARGIRIYQDMLRDGHVRSVVQTRRLAVLGKDWRIEAATEDPADQKVRDVVEESIRGIRGFERTRRDLLDGVLKGFAVGEVMWAARNGQIVPVEVRRRGQHRFVFDADGRLRLLTLQRMIDGEELPDRKFLVLQYDADPENPYGVGIGQSIYWAWWFKKHGIKFWVVFMDRFAQPLPMGKYPPGTDEATQEKLLDILKSIQTDQAVKIPNTLEITLLEAARTSTVGVYDPFIDKMNAEISKAVLGQTLTTQEGKTGSLALGQVQADVRQEIVEADADLEDEVFRDQLIRWIVDFNFGADVPAPWFVTETEAQKDMVALANRDKILHSMGTRIPETYVRDTYAIPEPQGDEPVLPPPSAGTPFAPLPGEFGEGAFHRAFARTDRLLRKQPPTHTPTRNDTLPPRGGGSGRGGRG